MAIDLTTRRGWGARTSRTGRPMGRVSHLVVHHFWRPDVPASASRATERSVMRGVEAFHASQGWSAAPGYQLVVFDSGRAYEGVGLGRQGVHTKGINSTSIAFCFGNDGDAAQPTDAAWATAQALRKYAVDGGYLTPDYRLTGHRDHAAKSCPGNRTYPHIGRVRSDAPPTDEDPNMIDTKSAAHRIRLFQTVLAWWGGQANLAAARGLAADGVWGKNTEAAWQAVAKATRFTAATTGRVEGPEFVALLHAVPPEVIFTQLAQ